MRLFFAPQKSHSPTVTSAEPASWPNFRSLRSRFAAERAPSARRASHLNRCAQTDATGVGSRERALYQTDDGITKRRTCCHWPPSSSHELADAPAVLREYRLSWQDGDGRQMVSREADDDVPIRRRQPPQAVESTGQPTLSQCRADGDQSTDQSVLGLFRPPLEG